MGCGRRAGVSEGTRGVEGASGLAATSRNSKAGRRGAPAMDCAPPMGCCARMGALPVLAHRIRLLQTHTHTLLATMDIAALPLRLQPSLGDPHPATLTLALS